VIVSHKDTNERVAETDARGTTRKVQVLNPAALPYLLTSLKAVK
jgi:hypothetical protein